MANVKFKLKQEKFLDMLKEKNLTIPQFSEENGLSFVKVYRVVNGENKPGGDFIAATMRTFNMTNLDEMFEY